MRGGCSSHRVGVALACMLGLGASALGAAPILPTSDDAVIEVLPALTLSRIEERQLRRQLALQPHDAPLALAAAERYLAQARTAGDPRFAGMALAAISAWTDPATMPGEILLMRATLEQYLHEFDASAASLQLLLARPRQRVAAQAWLTLATVRRVQGRYADSDAACHELARFSAALHANACLAENAALRGEFNHARNLFNGLLSASRGAATTQAWLATSLAELEQRAGNNDAAERAFRSALALDADPYTTLSYADFLIAQRRPAQALALLNAQTRTDAVLLRLAIAGTQAHAASAAADVAEMRARIALANERPNAKIFHGREQAMFALAIEGDAVKALDLARGNLAAQREPLDLLVFAQAAQASGRPEAQREARRMTSELGLVDQRIERLL